MEYVDVLGSSGRPVGKMKPKSEVHCDGDWHGVAHLWILNREGQILIQRRSPTKENWPNLSDVSVAGHISAGEGPVEAALREAQEELGVTLVPGECSHLFSVAEHVSPHLCTAFEPLGNS
jgi:isopentenyl-diphosphate Delta-isomerase